MTDQCRSPERLRSEEVQSTEVLSRDLLSGSGFAALMASEAPTLRVLTEDELDSSLAMTLSARPEGDVWVFAYGSLIWNPVVRTIESRPARVDGWHRSFCLSAIAGRGSPENPGLVLGLDEGGYCEGVALRIAEQDMADELPLLWRREMVLGSYIPRWLNLIDNEGRIFGRGITFTIDDRSRGYAGDLPLATVVRRLATASGSIGSSSDYLFRTRDGLRSLGICDKELEDLALLVQKVQALDAATLSEWETAAR